jgi:hypothetical protein
METYTTPTGRETHHAPPEFLSTKINARIWLVSNGRELGNGVLRGLCLIKPNWYLTFFGLDDWLLICGTTTSHTLLGYLA